MIHYRFVLFNNNVGYYFFNEFQNQIKMYELSTNTYNLKNKMLIKYLFIEYQKKIQKYLCLAMKVS